MTMSFIYSIFDDGFDDGCEFLGITLNDSFDRLRIERQSWDGFIDNTYYRFYRIDKNKGEKLFDIAKSLAI